MKKRAKHKANHNDFDRETAKMLTLSSGKNNTYKYLAGADTFTREKSIMNNCHN